MQLKKSGSEGGGGGGGEGGGGEGVLQEVLLKVGFDHIVTAQTELDYNMDIKVLNMKCISSSLPKLTVIKRVKNVKKYSRILLA